MINGQESFCQNEIKDFMQQPVRKKVNEDNW